MTSTRDSSSLATIMHRARLPPRAASRPRPSHGPRRRTSGTQCRLPGAVPRWRPRPSSRLATPTWRRMPSGGRSRADVTPASRANATRSRTPTVRGPSAGAEDRTGTPDGEPVPPRARPRGQRARGHENPRGRPAPSFSTGLHSVEMLVVSGVMCVVLLWSTCPGWPCCPELVEAACSILVSTSSGRIWGPEWPRCGESTSAAQRLCVAVENHITSPQPGGSESRGPARSCAALPKSAGPASTTP